MLCFDMPFIFNHFYSARFDGYILVHGSRFFVKILVQHYVRVKLGNAIFIGVV